MGPTTSREEDESRQLVVMPRQAIVSRGGDFLACSHPFFSQVTAIDEVDSWLEFPVRVPLTLQNKLFVRSSFKAIADQILASERGACGRKYAVIAGTSGIGKSVFLYYVLWRLIKAGKRVLFVTETLYFDGSSVWNCLTQEIEASGSPICGVLWTRRTRLRCSNSQLLGSSRE